MRASVALLPAIVLALATACGPARRPGIPPRNLVLVTIGAARADRLSCFQHPAPTTSLPSTDELRAEGRAMGLDDLAAAGVIFARCYAPSPSTVVSLASLFTGRSPLENGVTHELDVLPPDVPVLTQLFGSASFHTAAFVAAPRLDLERSFARAFDVFAARATDEDVLDAARAWLQRDRGDGVRTFVWIHLEGTEPPFQMSTRNSEVAAILGAKRFGAPDDDALAAQYDRALAATAARLSVSLSDAFDYERTLAPTSEDWARTVFVLAGASGAHLGEDGLTGHAGTLHECALHVPLILRHPDSLTGQRILASVVELQDVLPTLVEWFDLRTPARVEGRSLLPLLDSYVERPFEQRAAVTVLPERIFSARAERYHLVWNPLRARPKDRPTGAPDVPEVALYDVERDPRERHDLAPARPEVVAALQRAVKSWRDARWVYPPERRPKR